MDPTLENSVKAAKILSEGSEEKAVQQVDEDKDIVTGPQDIDDFKEFWGSAISRNRYLREKTEIEDRKIKIQERVDWVENQIYNYLTDKRGCEEVCSILIFSEFADLLNFWNKVLFYEVQKELFKKGIRIVISHNYYLKPFWRKKKTASFEVFATFLVPDNQVYAALSKHYANKGSKLGFHLATIETLKTLFAKKILGIKE